MKLTIAPELKQLPVIDYRKVKTLQGDLKYLAEEEATKLKASMTNHGFFVPFFIWKDKKGTAHMIDGHQRQAVLLKGNSRPYKLPYVQIHADTREAAAEKLLLVTGQYGKVTERGWSNFMDEFAIESSTIDAMMASFDFVMPDVGTSSSGFKPTLDPKAGGVGMTQERIDRAKGKMEDKFSTVKNTITCTCPHCGEDFQISM